MRVLLWVSVLLVGLWSGYWVTGKIAVERALAGFFQQAPDHGLIAENGGVSIAGFPNRFDLTVSDPFLSDPASGVSWRAPFLQILSLSYRPWHVIAAFAPEQVIGTAAGNVRITNEKLQASVVVTPDSNVTLERTTLVGTGLTATAQGLTHAASEVRFATERDDAAGMRHHIGLTVEELRPDAALTTPLQGLPPTIGQVHLDAMIDLSAPLDRNAGETRPRLVALDLSTLRVTWGELAVTAQGKIDVIDGVPDGRLDLSVMGWRRLMPLIAASNAVKPEVLPTIERMLETLALQSGNSESLDLPLIFSNGTMRLGPLPLGPAPRF